MEEELGASSESKELIKPKLNRFAKEFIPTKPVTSHITTASKTEKFGDYSDDEFPCINSSVQNENNVKKKRKKHKKKKQVENENDKPSYASILKQAVKPPPSVSNTVESNSIVSTINDSTTTQTTVVPAQTTTTAASSSSTKNQKRENKLKEIHKKHKTKNQITASSNIFAKTIRSAPVQPKPQNTVIFKGKQREFKRKKKISKLKRLVLAQRQQQLQDHGVDTGYVSDICSMFPSSSTIPWEDATEDMIPNYFSDDGLDKKQLIKEVKPKEPKKLELRNYVNHDISRALNTVCIALILKLKFFQKRLKLKEPLKYESRKKFCVGLRETLKALKAQHIKAILMAPNIEDVEVLNTNYIIPILQLSAQQNVKVIFCLSKRKFGKLFKKPMASCVGVYRVDPANDEYKSILTLWKGLREKFEQSEEKTPKCLY